MRRLLRRLWYLLRARHVDADLEAELKLHRTLLEEAHRREGADPTHAALAARRTLGHTMLAADEVRDAVLPAALRDAAADVRFAIRLLTRDRRVTLAAVLALGLGIGVNGSVFALINAALIRPLPFDEADRLVGVEVVERDGRTYALSHDDYVALNAAVTSVEGLGVSMNAVMNVSDGGKPPERLRGAFISGNTLSLLRSGPMLGRGLLPEDERPGAPAVILLGHGLWRSRYGADPSIVGRSIRINNVPTAVIGVMPEGFTFPFIAEAWQPLSASPQVTRSPSQARVLRGGFARLAADATPERAQREIEAAVVRLAQAAADRQTPPRVQVRPLKEGYTHFVKAPLFVFMGAVAVVLLVACANVATLLLARAVGRMREMAIRASLGATRWRLVRQLLVECLVLALLGGALGMALSYYGARAIAVAFSPIEPGVAVGALTPFWLDLGLDRSSLGFFGLACVLASLLFGLAPALHVARVDVNAVLKDGERGATSRRARRWTSAFVIAEVALTLVLLTGAGLLWRSFYALYTRDLGVDVSGVVSMRLTLPEEKYETPETRRQFMQQLEAALDAAPGVTAASLATQTPFSFGGPTRTLIIEGIVSPPSLPPPSVSYVAIGTRYFEVLGLSLRAGRAFPAGDPARRATEVIVDQRFVAMYAPTGDAIGRRIRLTPPAGAPSAAPAADAASWLTIVGIAPGMATPRPVREASPIVYVALRDEAEPGPSVTILARGDHGAATSVASLRERLRALDPDLPLYAVETLEGLSAQARTPQRLLGRWFGIIAVIALVLATVGVWSVTAQGVAARTREVGVRIALGARTSHIIWLFVRHTSALLAGGLVIGLGGSLLAGPLLRAFLVQTDARDPLTLTIVASLLALVALAAAVLPARRASTLDPIAVLRRD
jgi:putative ABC transport system permease protein